MLFDKLSPTTDFISKTQSDLLILIKNVLYVTHECDKILKVVKAIHADMGTQKQVDEWFDRDQTSPQTDTDEHE